MSEPKETKIAMEGEIQTNEPQDNKPGIEGLSRRAFLGVGSAGLASAALASLAVNAQERADTEKAEHDHSASNQGPENKPLLDENPNTNLTQPTDLGQYESIRSSFVYYHIRID